MINIYVVLAVLFSASHVFANPKESKAALACEVLFNPKNIEKMCCASMEKYFGDAEECEGISSDEYSCDKAICWLNQINVLDAENEVDEKKYEEHLDNIEKENPKEKSTIDNIKKQCLGGKFKKYPSPDSFCPSMKLQLCTYLHSTVDCTMWKSDEGCGELETSAAECKPYMNQVLEEMDNSISHLKSWRLVRIDHVGNYLFYYWCEVIQYTKAKIDFLLLPRYYFER